MRQEAPYKICECGRGKVYTSSIDSARNGKVDGRRVCNECVIDNIYKKFKEKNES